MPHEIPYICAIYQNYWTYVVHLALLKVTLICIQMCIHCYVRIICYLQYMHVFIYICLAHPSRLYTNADWLTYSNKDGYAS